MNVYQFNKNYTKPYFVDYFAIFSIIQETLPFCKNWLNIKEIFILCLQYIQIIISYQDMPNWIKFTGEVGYTFNPPYVTITCDRIDNKDKYQSGGILVQLFNTSLKASQNFGRSKLIGSFTLDQLWGGYGYSNIRRTVEMEDDVIHAFMVITVSENYSSGYQQSDMVEFNKPVKNRVNKRPFSTKRSSKGYRITTVKNGFKQLGQASEAVEYMGGLSKYKNAFKQFGQISGAVGTIGGFFCPALGAIGAVGGLIGAVGNKILELAQC